MIEREREGERERGRLLILCGHIKMMDLSFNLAVFSKLLD